MRVGLLVTCLVDLLRPQVGFAALRLLESAGCEVIVPPGQTCCGPPAFNAGDRRAAVALAKKTIAEFESFEWIVVPSGSCADQVINEYPGLIADDPEWAARAAALAAKTRELCQFLEAHVDRLPVRAASDTPATVAYHDSCTGLRGLGIKAQPRTLLDKLAGLRVTEAANCEDCCGFGGTFSVKFGEISAAIAERKCNGLLATGADTVVGGDLGCLLNIEGKLRRMGHDDIAVRHIAELLAGPG